MMNEDGRLERLESRVADIEREVQRLSAAAYRTRAATPAVPFAEPQAPPLAVPASAQPRLPASFEDLVAGRGLQIAGALLVLLGCAFFLDLAFMRGWIGPAERILLGLAAGSALVGFGSRILKPAYRALGEALIGLGAGILYLSLWASIQVADLHVSYAVAFAAMIAVTAALAALAAKRRSQATAAFGALGGFLTPVLLAGGPTDRVVLAAYILILAVAMLGLAARYAFGWLEILSLASVLAYAGAFAPNVADGWPDTSAAIVATLFFLAFAVAVSLGAGSDANRSRRVTILTIATVSYATMLELIFGAERVPRGLSELALSAALLGAARIRPLDRPMARTYGYLALGTITLAVTSLMQGSGMLDALTIEAGVVFLAGRRSGDQWLPSAAIALLAIAGGWDVVRDATFDHASALDVATSSAVWLAIAGSILWMLRDAKEAGANALLAYARIAFDFVAVWALTRAVFDLFGYGNPLSFDVALSSRGQFAVSAVWTAYGAGLFLYGLRRKGALLRWEGLALLGCTILKVFAVDLATIDIEWRVLSSIVLGGVLFAMSALYVRSTKAASAAPAE